MRVARVVVFLISVCFYVVCGCFVLYLYPHTHASGTRRIGGRFPPYAAASPFAAMMHSQFQFYFARPKNRNYMYYTKHLKYFHRFIPISPRFMLD